MTSLTGWRLPLGLATVAAAGAWTVSDQLQRYEPPPPGDRVRQAVAALEASNVYVAPDARELIDEQGAQRVAAAAAAADPEVFVVIWTPSTDAGYYLESDAVAQMAFAAGEDGSYLLVDDSHYLVSHQTGSRRTDGYVGAELYGHLDEALVDHIQQLDALPVTTRGFFSPTTWATLAGSAALGALAAQFAFGALVLLVGVVRLLGGRSFLLPTTAPWLRTLLVLSPARDDRP